MTRFATLFLLALGARPALAALEPPFAVNCGAVRWEGGEEGDRDGGSALRRKDLSGGPILPDLPYERGRGYGHEGGEALEAWYFGPHAGPDPRFLCGPGRAGTFAYRFDLAAGRYAIQIGVFERGAHGPGVRVFDVLCGDRPLFEGLDPFRVAGLFNGFRVTGIVEHPGGALVLRFVPRTSKPAIASLIRVLPAPEGGPESAPARAPGEVRAIGSYGRNAIFWAPIEDPWVDRYEVLRAEARDGPFRAIGEPRRAPWAFDDAAPIGREVWYAVRTIAVGGTRGRGSAPRAATAEPISAVRLPLYEIEIAPDDLAKLLAAPTSDEEVPGRFRFRDRAWDVDVRFRGASTRHLAKKSFKVRFPQDRLFDGRRTLALKAEEADWTMLQEILSYDAARRAGVLCSEAKPVAVRVNGEYLGVYADVEFVDDAFKRRAGLDPAGLLVRLQSFLHLPPGEERDEERDGDREAPGRPRGAVRDLAPLRRFVEALNRTAEGEFAAFLDASVAVDGLARFLAANALMARPETEADDAFLYHDPETGRFSWIPWDNNNGNWGIAAFSLEREWWRFSLFRQTIEDMGPEPRWSWLLWSRALRVPAFRARFLDLTERFAREILAPDAIGAMIDARFAEILEDARRDVYRWPRGGIDAFLRGP
ncbi:MAG: CotH kinase family protein, partial [Planctomycetes bacterium]|nr:CotH kinase family protein [Planctomycetota bacterium]